jgi:hypothetical protein
MNGPHLRSLQKALELLHGSKPRLAAALSISGEQLESYLVGKEALPHQTFLSVLDIVSGATGA